MKYSGLGHTGGQHIGYKCAVCICSSFSNFYHLIIDVSCLFPVPSFGPMGVEANATSSTTIVVKWGDVPREHQNGQIEGFKVYYGSNPRLPFQVCRFIFNI
jgi:hypothetical protein